MGESMPKKKKPNQPKEIKDIIGKQLGLSPSRLSIIRAGEEIAQTNPWDADEVGYMSREMVQVAIPHDNPGTASPVWTRRNGNVCLSISPKYYEDKSGKQRCIGYPYGTIPRLLMLYLFSEAKKKGSRTIDLGGTMGEFLRTQMHMDVSGGPNGTITRFKQQARRLFTANFDLTYDSEERTLDQKANIAESVELWWNENPDQLTLFDNYVILNHRFFQQLTEHPVPFDMRAVRALQQSCLALDLYFWLCHRITWVKKKTFIPWRALSMQTGADYSNIWEFARYAKKELRKIKALWPELKIEEVRGGLNLYPSSPHVPNPKIIALRGSTLLDAPSEN